MKHVRVDIISDIMCPWCLIGWLKFQQVMAHYADQLTFDVRWRPLELNPAMPADGVNAAEYLAQRYSLSPAKGSANRQNITSTAAALGFDIKWGADFRMRNSFNGHRLLSWAEAVGDQPELAGKARGTKQMALKLALFRAHFSEGRDVNDAATLAEIAASVGLDTGKVGAILAGDDYGDIVRSQQAEWQDHGISVVPTFRLEQRMMVPGAQDPDVFIRVIDRKILAASAEAG